MQLWKWLLIIGILFLITYNPSTRTMAKYFDDPRIETGDVFISAKSAASREAQSDSSPSDDD